MTYQDLLNRIDNLRGLAISPQPGETSGSMSSFDRASAYDANTGCYLNWDANDDGSGCIRKLPNDSIVAFECEGPGVIWRIWSALPEHGSMRVFFDDKDTPRIDIPFIDWFEKNAKCHSSFELQRVISQTFSRSQQLHSHSISEVLSHRISQGMGRILSLYVYPLPIGNRTARLF